jgi:hypothetical protein
MSFYLIISRRPFTIGAVAGAAGVALARGAVALLDSRLGGSAGLIVGAAAGGLGAWLAVRAFQARMIAALASPRDRRGDSSRGDGTRTTDPRFVGVDPG